MTEADFQQILTTTIDRFLCEMKGPEFKGHYPPNPTPYHINDGLCEDFANDVCELVPDAKAVWDGIDEVGHCQILWHGKFYDAECVGGVADYHLLPIYENHSKPV